MSEPGQVVVTLLRDGPTDTQASIRYRTLDLTAVDSDDYDPIIEVIVIFEPGQVEVNFTVTARDDLIPETDEIFEIELYDPIGR